MGAKGKSRVQPNVFPYLLLGSITSIFLARSYVALGGPLALTYNGLVLHHFYYGLLFIVVGGLTALTYRVFMTPIFTRFLFLLIGGGLGLITDEINIITSVGHPYTLALYYAPVKSSPP